MPTPLKGESQKDFVSRCIPLVLREKTAKSQAQASAICHNMWRKEKSQKVEEENKMPNLADAEGKCPSGMTNHGGYCFKTSELKSKSPEERKKMVLEMLKKLKASGQPVQVTTSPVKVKQKSKMTSEKEKSDKEVSLFNTDKVDKLKDIVNKLENAESLEAAKLLVVEFKSFVDEVSNQESSDNEGEKGETDTADKEQEQPEKEQEAESENSEEGEKQEQKGGEQEADKKEEPESKEEGDSQLSGESVSEEEKDMSTQLNEAIELNNTALKKLKEADKTIMTLEGINDKLKKENEKLSTDLDKTKKDLSVYVEKEEKAAKERYEQKFASVFTDYCKFMEIPEDEKESLREMMSTYSEDMLDKTAKFLDNKSKTLMEAEPDVKTSSSSDLEAKEHSVMTRDQYDKLSPQDKTDYLFSLMVKNQK